MAWDRFGRRPKEDPVHGYVWGGGGGPHGSYMTNRDITGSEFTGYDMYDQPMKIGRRGPIHALARGYVDPEIDFRDMDPGMTPGGKYGTWKDQLGDPNKNIYGTWKDQLGDPNANIYGTWGDQIGRPTDDDLAEWLSKQAYKADGGAVGLEPGIASLMGYAKGGMVTRVRVPKGQSKWMKKFMNNMRDN